MHPLLRKYGSWALRHIKGLVVSLVALVLGLVFKVDQQVTRWIEALKEWARADAGILVLLLVLWLAVVAALALFDNSRIYALLKDWLHRKRPEPVPPRPALSNQDRDAIHMVRVLWSRNHAAEAAERIHELLASGMVEIRERYPDVFWVDLLIPIREEIQNARVAMTAALESSSGKSPQDVADALSRVYVAYARAARWLQETDDRVFRIPDGAFADRYNRWEKANHDFHEALVVLGERPEFEGARLRVNVHDPVARGFLTRGGAQLVDK